MQPGLCLLRCPVRDEPPPSSWEPAQTTGWGLRKLERKGSAFEVVISLPGPPNIYCWLQQHSIDHTHTHMHAHMHKTPA